LKAFKKEEIMYIQQPSERKGKSKMLRRNLRSRLIKTIFVFAALSSFAFSKTIYVDDDATGANNGTSWGNAYRFLQDALADANSAEKPVEILVAQGVYRPDQGADQALSDREATFQLINDVTLKGGYSGLGVTDPNARDIRLNETVLTGDLASNDISWDELLGIRSLTNYNLNLSNFDEPNREDNAYNVLIGSEADETAVLDGFTITGGRAGGFDYSGGGMYSDAGSPTIVACTFTRNLAYYCGGGIYCENDSNPTLTNCTVSKNWALFGGGMCNENSNPSLINCTFTENFSEVHSGAIVEIGYQTAGGMDNYYSNPKLTNCTFSENSGRGMFGISAGGMFNYQSNPNMNNCIFIGNTGGRGGGVYNKGSNPALTNCFFIGNLAIVNGYIGEGGAIFNDSFNYLDRNYTLYIIGSNPIFTNCIFSGNLAEHGAGIYNIGGTNVVTNCTFVQNSAQNGRALACDSYGIYKPSFVGVANCILGDGGNEIWNNDGSIIGVNYSDIQGGQASIFDPCEAVVWSEGNIDVDPLFAELGYRVDSNNPNVIVEPNEPDAVWIDGDYHLKSEVGRWDGVSESWVVDDVTSPCIDAGDPNSLVGDEPEPNGGRINMGAYGGTAEASKSPTGAEQIVYIQWLGHASVKVWTDDCIVYVDPQRLSITPHDATLVFVTHAHGDHYSPSDIARVSNAGTQFIAPPDVVSQYGSGQAIAPGQTIEFDFVTIKAVPAYNINKTNHPKSNNWVGYIIELGDKRIYVAGDTDLIEEMKSLGDINVAFLPAGGTYTMNATEAAEATGYIKPDLAIPYHWGQVVGTLADAQRFVELARCPAMVLAVGETISSDNWPEYSPLIAHWALDEAEGNIAHDGAGDNNGTLYGEPTWQPVGGKIAGALQFDGIDDYASSDFVLDPANGPFSVFAWIKGGTAGQTVISQADGTGSGEPWLGADASLGRVMTGLVAPPAGRFVPQPLVSEFVITDGQWHHIGFVWDGSYRILYADGAEVAEDTAAQNPLKSADGGLYIGAGKTLEAGTFFTGMVDDVRIYNIALTADEVEALVH
jgi:parallel beta-helix repeat protein